jgi:hypothetical protein
MVDFGRFSHKSLNLVMFAVQRYRWAHSGRPFATPHGEPRPELSVAAEPRYPVGIESPSVKFWPSDDPARALVARS